MTFNLRSVQLSDGTQVAYGVEGTGPALVLTNGLTTTSSYWKYLRLHWLEKYKVVTWDLPGHGASSPARSARSATIEGQPDILARVMDAAEVDSATQIGFSVGCQVVLEMARHHSARCHAIVALLGPAGRMLDTTRLPLDGRIISQIFSHLPPRAFAPLYRVLSKAADLPGTYYLARGLSLAGPRTSNEDIALITAAVAQADPETIHRLALSAQQHSAHDLLGSLRVPLLIVAGEKDPFAPSELVGEVLHRAAQHSELALIPKGTHTAMLEDPSAVAAVIDRFLERHAPRQ